MAGTLDTFIRGAVIAAIFALGNLVAGGILVLLGTQAMKLPDGALKTALMIAIMLLAVGCALIFIKGCMRELDERLQYRSRRQTGGSRP